MDDFGISNFLFFIKLSQVVDDENGGGKVEKVPLGSFPLYPHHIVFFKFMIFLNRITS